MGNVISLAASIGLPLVTGTAIGLSIAPEIKKWYPTIKKPSWNPPNSIFGPVWSLLYTLMGIASWRVWHAGGGALPLSLYGLQLVLNFAWSPIFFKKHDLKLASAEITVLLGVLAATIVEFHKVDPAAAYMLLPYFGWSAFATALTLKITALNSGSGKGEGGGGSVGAGLGAAAAGARDAAIKATSEATANSANIFLAQAGERQDSTVPPPPPAAAAGPGAAGKDE